jgi:CBS domain-containing protein
MHVTEESSGVDLNEPVKTLLAQKGDTLWTIPPDASVFDAIVSMSDARIGALLVISVGQMVGIITERDYARKVILKGRQSRETRVHEIMSAPVWYVSPEDTVGQCMQLMTSRRIRHLPVVEDDRIVGLVSIGDLVNWIMTAQKETIRLLHNYINGSYPG